MEPGTFSGFLGIPGERRRKHGTGIPDVICVCWRAAAVAQRSTAHPFRDGKGRISGIVQSLVLAREGLLAREFSSIEEYPGYHTTDYYRVLRAVQGGSYQPTSDARPWLRFCIDAHLQQARGRLIQVEAATRRWALLEQEVEARGWPDRLVIALEQSLFGGAGPATYAAEADASFPTATGDLRRLADA